MLPFLNLAHNINNMLPTIAWLHSPPIARMDQPKVANMHTAEFAHRDVEPSEMDQRTSKWLSTALCILISSVAT